MLKQVIQSIKKILAPPIFPEDEDKTRKARYTNLITLIFLSIVVAFQVWARLIGGYVSFSLIMDGGMLILIGLGIASLVLLQRGQVRFTSIVLVTMIWLASNGMAVNFGVKDVTYIANFAVILMAGLLLDLPAALIFTVLSILSGFGLAYAEQSGWIQAESFPIMYFAGSLAIIFGLNAALIWLLIGGLENALKKSRLSVEELASANAALNYTQSELQDRGVELTSANKQLENRSQKLHGIAEVARTTTSIRSFDQLLPAITRAISEQLGYYHVGLFLLDEEKQYTILRAANTPDGLRMMNRGYRMAVGSINPIGYIAQTGQPRVTHTMSDDSTFLHNLDLPESRSQIVLPLGAGAEIIGVLDIQSREVNAFSEDDLSILSIMSDQITIAIKNALLYEQSQSALREANTASRQVASQAWEDYGRTIRTRGYRYDGIKSEPLKDVKQARRETDALMVPVQLRDQTIGCLKLKAADPSRQWTDDELAMVKATADRVALALEGARLLDEAQKRAAREAFLSDVATKLSTSFQLDSILRDTVEELGQTLKNSTVTFQLVNPSAPPAAEPQKSNGASTDRNIVE